MKIQVMYTVDVSEETRRAMRTSHGETGMATREEVKAWFELNGNTMDEELARLVALEDIL